METGGAGRARRGRYREHGGGSGSDLEAMDEDEEESSLHCVKLKVGQMCCLHDVMLTIERYDVACG